MRFIGRCMARRRHKPSRCGMVDNKAIVCLLRSEVKRAGGQSSWAKREGIDRTMVNSVLRGRRLPTEKIIRALKLCNVYALGDDQVAN